MEKGGDEEDCEDNLYSRIPLSGSLNTWISLAMLSASSACSICKNHEGNHVTIM